MSNQAGENMPEGSGVTLVQVWGEFKHFQGAMTTQMSSLKREVRTGLEEIKDAVSEHDGTKDELATRLTIVEGKQAVMYKILSAVGGVVTVLMLEAARRYFFGA